MLINLAGVAGMAQAQIAFEEVTATAGPFHTGESYGAAWGDFNGDGRPDLHVNNHRHRDSIYRNNGNGTFSDVTLQVDSSSTWVNKPKEDTHGGSWANFDGDEDQDLLVSTGQTAPGRFFVNEGGVFVERAVQYNVAQDAEGRFASWLDFDNDGRTDILMAIHNVSRLWQQGPTTAFNDVTTDAGVACGALTHAFLSDLNNDGRMELICAPGIGPFPNRIYDTTLPLPFENITPILPSTNLVVDTASGDFDGDLRPDLFLVRGRLRPTEARRISSSRIEAHVATEHEKGFSFTGSGPITIDIATDERDRISLNSIFIGSGGSHPAAEPFTLDPASSQGIKAHNPAVSQGLYVGVVDSVTQKWEIRASPGGTTLRAYLTVTGTSLSAPTAIGLRADDLPVRPRLLRNTATGFQDQTGASGLNTALSCVSAAAGDFDNDRDVDLYVVCRGGVQNLPNRLFENLGNGVFDEVSEQPSDPPFGAEGIVGAGLQSGAGTGESVVVADYDLDGFLDLFLTNGLNLDPLRVGGPDQLIRNVSRNVGNSNRWVELQLRGTVSNPDAIGATVFATAGGVTQLREQNGGYHRWSQHHSHVHFGLGVSNAVDLEVRWPRGQVDVFSGVTADALYRVTEGASSGTGTIEPVVLGPGP